MQAEIEESLSRIQTWIEALKESTRPTECRKYAHQAFGACLVLMPIVNSDPRLHDHFHERLCLLSENVRKLAAEKIRL